VKSDIESAASSIRDFYLAHGYRDVVVETPQYRFSENRDRVDLFLRIREGMRYEVRSVDYRGDVTPDARLALEELKRKTTGQPYTSRTRMLVTAGVAEIYGNLGYPDAVVDVSERTDAGGQVGLDAAIAKGPLVTVADVSIRGNQRTNEEFIRRRLKLKAGDRYNQALEKASFRELYKSGVFSKVEINLEKTAVADRRVLAVTVQEAPSLELSFEPGYGAYEKLRLTVGLREKNLFGTGRAWKSEGLVSFKDQRISTSLSDPWFLDTDFRADLTLAAERREEPSFTSSVWGSDFTLAKDLGPHLSATAGYSFRNTQLTGVDVDIEEVDAGKNYNIATVKTQLTYDTRNDLFFPTTGQRTIGGIEHADTLLGGEVTLTRLTAGTRFFFPLTRSTVLGLRYSTGLIIPGTDETTVPLPERFFNGGENTVRSFKESELGPQNSKNNPAGGLGYNVASMELRQRLYGNFTGSLFTDIGNVAPNRTREEEGKPPYRNRSQVLADTLGDFFSGFRSAVGFGVQYLLPVGPARLDVAFNPDRDTSRNEDLYVIVFSVGWAF
jgi:outer membrane protein assembly complex protein YaeT